LYSIPPTEVTESPVKAKKTMLGAQSRWLHHPLLRKYAPLIHEDLAAVYARDLRKWLVIAPMIGVVTGLLITALVLVILKGMWPPILNYFLHHHWAMVPGLLLGSRRTLNRRDYPELPRTQGRPELEAFFPKTAGGDCDGRFWR
jgi:hypothetical protein